MRQDKYSTSFSGTLFYRKRWYPGKEVENGVGVLLYFSLMSRISTLISIRTKGGNEKMPKILLTCWSWGTTAANILLYKENISRKCVNLSSSNFSQVWKDKISNDDREEISCNQDHKRNSPLLEGMPIYGRIITLCNLLGFPYGWKQ